MAFTKAELRAVASRIRKAQSNAMKGLRIGEESAVKEIISLLKQLQKDLRVELASIGEESFKAQHLEKLQIIIDQAMDSFTRQAKFIVKGKTSDAVELARSFWIDQLDNLKTIDKFTPSIPIILPEQTLAVVSNLSTELVSGLAEETRKKLKVELQKAILGNKTPFEAVKDLEAVIGVRGGVGATAAAERIVRTEMNRAYSMADELIRNENQDKRPEDAPRIIKIWATAQDGRVRASHAEMDKVYVFADEDFSVPIAGKAGELTGQKEDMSGPHDPKASASNVVNCRCTTYTVPEYMASEFGATEQ